VPEDLSPTFHRPARSGDRPGEAAAVRRIMPTEGPTPGPPPVLVDEIDTGGFQGRRTQTKSIGSCADRNGII